MRTVRVATAQISPVYLNKERSIDKACVAIEEAARQGAQLIVFPEAFISGYPDWVWVVPPCESKLLNQLYVQLVDSALDFMDPALDLISEVAGDCEISVLFGANERNFEGSNSSLYNSFYLIDSHGEIGAHHRKLVPTGAERMVWAQGDGSSMHAHGTSAGIVGGLICWENYMPLARQELYNRGIQILAAPTWDKSPGWIQSMQHIAREGGVFVVSSCMPLRMDQIPDDLGFKEYYGNKREWINSGNSCIIAPNGQILAGPLNEEEGIIYADLDFGLITAAKRLFDVSGHYARPDVFAFFNQNQPTHPSYLPDGFGDESDEYEE